jgi:hypothetical protein
MAAYGDYKCKFYAGQGEPRMMAAFFVIPAQAGIQRI